MVVRVVVVLLMVVQMMVEEWRMLRTEDNAVMKLGMAVAVGTVGVGVVGVGRGGMQRARESRGWMIRKSLRLPCHWTRRLRWWSDRSMGFPNPSCLASFHLFRT